ncbi:hypothetical protein ALC60_11692 [Trachymyrmex zeteki]|uniref:Uncharacterized protein n=1 Tax=Mycetomoellerius zeteki TaxID=64791 RepID=A0A151WNI1_9HYME|nr:hypothetical protein ALC60_11692 [Trachymyrmex zeteki]
MLYSIINYLNNFYIILLIILIIILYLHFSCYHHFGFEAAS